MSKSSDIPTFSLPAVHVVNKAVLKRQSNAVVVFFDARGTEFCLKRLQAFQEILPDLKAKGVEVYGISTDDDLGKTALWARDIGVEFPLLSDADGSVSRSFGLLNSESGHSERALVIIENGVVRHREVVGETRVPDEVLKIIR